MTTNPYMMMLKADPDKYIATASFTLLVLAKAIEGALGLLCAFPVIHFLEKLLSGGDRVLAPGALLPSLPIPEIALTGPLGRALGAAGAICVLLSLVLTAAEAVGLLAVRFARKGAGAVKLVRQILFWDFAVLLAAVVGVWGLEIVRYVTQGMKSDASLRGLPPLVIAAAVSLLLLAPALRYHRGIAAFAAAIDYEFRLGFKEMDCQAPKLGSLAVLYALLALAAAGLLGLRDGFASLPVVGLIAAGIQFLMVFSVWGDFRRCHR